MFLLSLSVFFAAATIAQQAPAPAPDPAAKEEAKQDDSPPTSSMVIEVGSRSGERSRTDTPVPVDVLPVSEVAESSGQLDVTQLLQFTAPSFNSNRQSGSDGSDHVDAATLRGLGPDQVLVLINGKRRHSSSLIYLFGSRARGNVGTDLNTIPIAAIDRIEILRDGAAAQYGSDAIAGVINIILKKEMSMDLLLAGGAFSRGDGENGQIALNYGLPLGKEGILSLTGEFLSRNKTDRSPAGEPRQIGDAATDNLTFFYNMDLPVGAMSGFYGHGGYNDRDGSAGAWYRGGLESDDIPSRNSAAMYPDGFVPTIGTHIRDISSTLGFRTLLGSWAMDLSTTYGANRMSYRIGDTLNASIATGSGGISPTTFDAGGFEFTQQTTNLDFSRSYPKVIHGLSAAAGLEHRRETYSIFAGERGSWDDFDGPGGGNAGSQGFPGFQPVDEVGASRNNIAAYVDMELKATERLLLTAAIRGEDYSDFGNTINGKVSAGYRVSPKLNFRGSASTGFRAPSLHQRYFSSTFTDFIAGQAADVKLAPNEGTLARLVGIPKLREEKSKNYSLGLTWNPRQDIDVTIDAYQIDIDDRIVLTGGFTGDDPDIGAIITAQNIVEARFFTNAIDTRTHGIDFTYAKRRAIGRAAQLTTTAAFNFNNTTVQHVNTAPGLVGKEDIYFNQRERLFVEGSAPRTKGSVGFDYTRPIWDAGLKFAYFGSLESGTWSQIDDPNAPAQKYDPRLTTDIHLGYEMSPGLRLTVGGTNIFDARPTAQDPNETENGALWENVQMGFNGASYFVRLGWKIPTSR